MGQLVIGVMLAYGTQTQDTWNGMYMNLRRHQVIKRSSMKTYARKIRRSIRIWLQYKTSLFVRMNTAVKKGVWNNIVQTSDQTVSLYYQAERGPWWISRRYTQRKEAWTHMKGSLIIRVLIPWYSTDVWYHGICVCVCHDCCCRHPKNDEWCQKKFTVSHFIVVIHPMLYALSLNVVQQIYQ